MPETYEDYLKNKKKGTTTLTRYAWGRHRQLQAEGKVPSNVDVAMSKVGAKPGPLTQRLRKRWSAQRGLLDFLKRRRK